MEIGCIYYSLFLNLNKGFNNMKVAVIGEYGHSQAMLGLSLNKKQPVDKMPNVAERLSGMDYGHNKFVD